MSQNGAFNGAPPWRPAAARRRLREGVPDAYPGQDEREIAELRRLDREAWRRLAPVAVDEPMDPAPIGFDEIEGYGCTSLEELGAQRDLELWGCDPFVED